MRPTYLFLLLNVAHCYTALGLLQTAVSQIQMHMVEEVWDQIVVGSIDELNCSSVCFSKDVIFEVQPDFFLVTGTYLVKISGTRVDRETTSMISLSIMAVLPPNFVGFINVTLFIDDINDNYPELYNISEPIYVPEDSAVGKRWTVARLVDPDENENGSMKADIIDSVYFKSHVESNSVLVFELLLSMDYENSSQPVIVVAVNVSDLGRPCLWRISNHTMHLVDVNDNAPIFKPLSYFFVISDRTNVDDVIGYVSARDVDSGANGEVSYLILEANSCIQLSVGKKNGRLVLRSLARVGSCNLTVMAIDHGEPPLNSTASVNILVTSSMHIRVNFTKDGYFKLHESMPNNNLIADVTVEGWVDSAFVEVEPSSFLFLKTVRPSVLQLHNRLTIDREVNSSVDFIVRVRNISDRSLLAEFDETLFVEDANDQVPVCRFRQNNTMLPSNISVGFTVVSVEFSDADVGINAKVNLTIVSGDGSLFSIDPLTGDIQLLRLPGDSDTNTFDIVVKATDGGFPPLASTCSGHVTFTRSQSTSSTGCGSLPALLTLGAHSLTPTDTDRSCLEPSPFGDTASQQPTSSNPGSTLGVTASPSDPASTVGSYTTQEPPAGRLTTTMVTVYSLAGVILLVSVVLGLSCWLCRRPKRAETQIQLKTLHTVDKIHPIDDSPCGSLDTKAGAPSSVVNRGYQCCPSKKTPTGGQASSSDSGAYDDDDGIPGTYLDNCGGKDEVLCCTSSTTTAVPSTVSSPAPPSSLSESRILPSDQDHRDNLDGLKFPPSASLSETSKAVADTDTDDESIGGPDDHTWSPAIRPLPGIEFRSAATAMAQHRAHKPYQPTGSGVLIKLKPNPSVPSHIPSVDWGTYPQPSFDSSLPSTPSEQGNKGLYMELDSLMITPSFAPTTLQGVMIPRTFEPSLDDDGSSLDEPFSDSNFT